MKEWIQTEIIRALKKRCECTDKVDIEFWAGYVQALETTLTQELQRDQDVKVDSRAESIMLAIKAEINRLVDSRPDRAVCFMNYEKMQEYQTMSAQLVVLRNLMMTIKNL